jgi:hypothetical protein
VKNEVLKRLMFLKPPLWANTNEITAFLLFEYGNKRLFKVPIMVIRKPTVHNAVLKENHEAEIKKHNVIVEKARIRQ